MGRANRFGDEDILRVFERLDDPSEPLATSEVAEMVGCARRTAYDKLDSLTEAGHIKTKKIGAQGRVWWRPTTALSTGGEISPTVTDSSHDDTDADLPLELTADEVLELEFESEQLAQPFLDLGHEDMSLRIEGFVRLPDGSHVQYWTVSGLPGETVLDLPNRFPTNEDVRLLKKEGDSYRVEVKGAESSLVSTYDEFDGESVTTVLEDGKNQKPGSLSRDCRYGGGLASHSRRRLFGFRVGVPKTGVHSSAVQKARREQTHRAPMDGAPYRVLRGLLQDSSTE
jgi:hypothetical protein